MRFFVTGGTGFLGPHLVRHLEERGHEVVVFCRRDSDRSLLDGRRCSVAEGSLFSPADLAAAMQGCDGVFHVAGNASWFRPDRKTVSRTNVEGTRAVVEAMRRTGIRRGVLTSSVSAVGLRDDRPADEDTPFNWPDSFAYPRSKREAEEIWFGGGFEAVAVNPATVFGPGDARMGIGAIFRAIQKGKFPRLRTGGISVCDVRDVARGHLLAFERGRSGRRYILGGDNLENRVLAERIAVALGVEPPRKNLSPFALRSFRVIAQGIEHLGMRLEIAAAHLWCMMRYVYHSTERARAEIGYAPRPFEETILDSIAWYREKGLLAAPLES